MKPIHEEVIESIILSFEAEANYLSALDQIYNQYPELKSYLDQENYTLLTNEELALLEYLVMVIIKSSEEGLGTAPKIELSKIEQYEDLNWEIVNNNNTKNFKKILDKYFENYAQEDLLALVEDSTETDDETIVTTVGREILVVACKSLIDCLDDLN